MEIPCIRFDDLSPGGSGSFGLLDPVEIVVARRVDDVVPALQEAEQAARDGLWVAGCVSYDASPAFNDLLSVRPSGLHDPMRELPLAHFQTFRRRIDLREIDSGRFPAGAYNVSAWNADSTQHEYKKDLAHIGRAIMAGEIAQLTHTFRLHAAFGGDPAALYRDLLMSQRGRQAACMDVGRFRLVSTSPEGFFRQAGDRLTVRPVLASARRGRWLEEDLQLAGRLRAEGEESYTNRMVIKEIESELAELGELVPAPTSDRFSVERFETLWHLTTELRASLRDEVGIVEIFRALFPPVSSTGVPKPEAMDLITATEDTARGVYCGAIGFLEPRDRGEPVTSFSVAIRTVVIDLEEGVAEFGVGTPITNRSDVVSAYEEARLKARVLVERRPDFSLVARLRVEDGVARHATEKLKNLVDSARYFGFVAEEGALREALAGDVAGGGDDYILSIVVDRTGVIEIEAGHAPVWCDDPAAAPVLIGAIATKAVSNEDVFLFHNTTDTRLADVLSRKYPDAEVVIVINQHDEVAGSLDGNVVARIDDRWLTPPLSCGAVGCELRAQLAGSGEIEERFITRDELEGAQEIALIDDLHGWRLVGPVG